MGRNSLANKPTIFLDENSLRICAIMTLKIILLTIIKIRKHCTEVYHHNTKHTEATFMKSMNMYELQ